MLCIIRVYHCLSLSFSLRLVQKGSKEAFRNRRRSWHAKQGKNTSTRPRVSPSIVENSNVPGNDGLRYKSREDRSIDRVVETTATRPGIIIRGIVTCTTARFLRSLVAVFLAVYLVVFPPSNVSPVRGRFIVERTISSNVPFSTSRKNKRGFFIRTFLSRSLRRTRIRYLNRNEDIRAEEAMCVWAKGRVYRDQG